MVTMIEEFDNDRDEVVDLDVEQVRDSRGRRITEADAAAIAEQALLGLRSTSGRPCYTAHATRDGDWWAITVLEVPGAFSQARQLDAVEVMARDAVALLLEIEPSSFDITVEVTDPACLQCGRVGLLPLLYGEIDLGDAPPRQGAIYAGCVVTRATHGCPSCDWRGWQDAAGSWRTLDWPPIA